MKEPTNHSLPLANLRSETRPFDSGEEKPFTMLPVSRSSRVTPRELTPFTVVKLPPT